MEETELPDVSSVRDDTYSTQLLDGVLDFVCELVLLNVQVEAVVHQRGRAFHKFHFTCDETTEKKRRKRGETNLVICKKIS